MPHSKCVSSAWYNMSSYAFDIRLRLLTLLLLATPLFVLISSILLNIVNSVGQIKKLKEGKVLLSKETNLNIDLKILFFGNLQIDRLKVTVKLENISPST